MRTRIYIWLILFCPFAYTLNANIEPRLEPAVVQTALGGHFYLQVHISDSAGADCRIEFSQHPAFEIHEAGISQTQSVRIIGSQVERTHTWIRNFMVRAKEVGQFTLGPVNCTIAGRVYKTGTAAIHVQAETRGTPPGQPGLGVFGRPFLQRDPFVRDDERIEFHVESLFDKKTAWVGEGVVQYVDIHASRPRITGVQFAQVSRDGFWEILPERYEQSRPLRYTRDGREWYRYRYAVAYLFPLTGGERVVPPFAVRVDYNQFWTRTQVFQTELLQLETRPLPRDAGRNFSGAVGNFDIAGHLDEHGGDFMRDKPLTLVLTVSGFGNIRSIQAPTFAENADFRIMPPQLNSQVRIRDGRIHGSQSFRYLIYPLREGTMPLPEARLRAFDPDLSRYYDLVYVSSPLTIRQGEIKAQNQEMKNYLYDFTLPESEYPPGLIPFAPIPALLLLSGALGFFFLGIARERRRRYAAENPRLARRAAAALRARTALRSLSKSASPEGISSSLMRALRLYASDRTGIGEGATFAVFADALMHDQVSALHIEEWRAFEERCTSISYAGGYGDPSSLMGAAEQILRHFEESRS